MGSLKRTGRADMTPQECSDQIKAAAKASGFDHCGITEAGPIVRRDYLANWLAKGCAGTMGYLHKHPASRVDVRTWLPWARSVVVVAMNYGPKRRNAKTSEPHDAERASHDSREPIAAAETGMSNSNPQSPILDSHEQASGRVAMYAWGEDYHVIVREKLDAMVDQMRAMVNMPLETRVCVDTAAIIERELAAAAGIGWIGKNTMVVHPSLGSFFVLGEIITNLELAADSPMPDRCGKCTRCLKACPTGALPRAYEMDARRCISYLTIEHRAEIEPDLASKMGNWVFGCDLCQMVCPYNRWVPYAGATPDRAESTAAAPLLEDILSWDAASHRAFVKGKATGRAKLHMWKRNAAITARNARS